jgi:hypothetical protein
VTNQTITVAELADELGLTAESLGRIAGLKSANPFVRLSPEEAEKAREEVARAMNAGDAEPETESVPEPQAEPLTLDNYEPSTIVTEALRAAVHVTTDYPADIRAQSVAVFMCAAVTLADLVEKGVAPYAEAPGKIGEPNRAATNALMAWITHRCSGIAVDNLLDILKDSRGRRSSMVLRIIEL